MKKLQKKFLFVLLLIFYGYSTIAQNDTEKNKIMNFKIEISKKYMGRQQNRVLITMDSVIIEENIAINTKNYQKEEKILTADERELLINSLAEFPLNDFKESYYNKKVKDGIQLTFHIEINNEKKNIYVSNYYIDELGKLIETVVKILQKDYFLYSNDMEHIDL